MIRQLLVYGGLVLMTACATNYIYTKPNLPDQEFRRDSYECERDARSTFRERGQTITELDVPFYERCMEARGWSKKAL